MDANRQALIAALQARGTMPMAQQGVAQAGIPNRNGMPPQPLQGQMPQKMPPQMLQGMQRQIMPPQMPQGMGQMPQGMPPQMLQGMLPQGMPSQMPQGMQSLGILSGTPMSQKPLVALPQMPQGKQGMNQMPPQSTTTSNKVVDYFK